MMTNLNKMERCWIIASINVAERLHTFHGRQKDLQDLDNIEMLDTFHGRQSDLEELSTIEGKNNGCPSSEGIGQ